ncbi:nuclear transport factor 2 family protein [Mucilaginibacter calamicampi]|uniref:Nuclear transport factor 2 family protein n=1 Tax=Mucilaginibacter calamicampi TaxID=1302352 RepID=A0ABW2Z400_9SPHI
MKKSGLILLLVLWFCSLNTFSQIPDGKQLYNDIVRMDSIYFDAYNHCDIDKQATIFADILEFYHDNSGLETSKTKLLAAIKENICGKVTRVLVPGSIEVYPLPGYGAVEIALHQFRNKAEGDQLSKPDKFVVVRRYQNKKWQITRVISLHVKG